MSKILLTNMAEWNNQLLSVFAKAGFEKSVSISDENYLTTYRKFNINNVNFYRDNEGDYIAICGTLVYKTVCGEKALSLLLEDIKQNGIGQARCSLYGTYAVVCHIQDVDYCFVDETGTYAFYYYECNGRYILTNTFYHIAKVTKLPLLQIRLLERSICFCNVLSNTPFRNVYRLLGDEVLRIQGSELRKEHIPRRKFQMEKTDYKTCLETIAVISQSIMEQTSCVSGNAPILFVTGGLDSRLLLANYLKCGKRPILGSWCGSPVVMNTKKEDIEIATMLSGKMSLKRHVFDVSGYDSARDYSQSLLEKFGEYAFCYGGNPRWFSILEDKGIEYVDYGHFGESLKDWEPLTAQNGDESFDWFVDFYCNRIGFNDPQSTIGMYRELREIIVEDFARIAAIEGIDIDNVTQEDCLTLFNWYRLHANTVLYQYANNYCYAFPLEAQKELFDIINQVPYVYKQRGVLNLGLVNSMAPALLEVPYFSHCKMMRYDKKTMTLDIGHVAKLKRSIGSMLQRSALGKQLLDKRRARLYALHARSAQEDVLNQVVCMCTASSSFGSLKLTIMADGTSGGYLVKLVQIAQECQMIDDLMVSNE